MSGCWHCRRMQRLPCSPVGKRDCGHTNTRRHTTAIASTFGDRIRHPDGIQQRVELRVAGISVHQGLMKIRQLKSRQRTQRDVLVSVDLRYSGFGQQEFDRFWRISTMATSKRSMDATPYAWFSVLEVAKIKTTGPHPASSGREDNSARRHFCACCCRMYHRLLIFGAGRSNFFLIDEAIVGTAPFAPVASRAG